MSSCSVAKGLLEGVVSQLPESGRSRNGPGRNLNRVGLSHFIKKNRHVLVSVMLQCDNARCKSKCKRVTVRRSKQHAHVPGLKFRRNFTRVNRRGTQGFSSEKFTKVENGNHQSRNGIRSGRICRRIHPRTPRCGNPRQVTAGRRRQVRLGLSGRCRTPYLRRLLQARHHPACPRAPRTGCGPCGRRLCPRDRRCWRSAGYIRSWRDQCGHRHCHGLHGQHSARPCSC